MNGDRFLAATSGGSFTVTLPADPVEGWSVSIADGDDWSINNVIVNGNGQTINELSLGETVSLNIKDIRVDFVYNGTTWQLYAYTGRYQRLANQDTVTDLGQIVGTVAVNMDYGRNLGELTGDVEVGVTNVDIGKSTTCYFYNPSTTATTTITFVDSEYVTLLGTEIDYILVGPRLTAAFTITTNDNIYYLVTVNSIEAAKVTTGLTTTWNPTDSAGGPVVVTDSNKTIDHNATILDTTWRTTRCFGPKSTGKWKFSVRVDISFTSPANSSGLWDVWMILGICPSSLVLTNYIGQTQTSYGVAWRSLDTNTTGSAGEFVYKSNNGNNVLAITGIPASYTPVVVLNAGTIITVLCDFDNNKIWFAADNIVADSGNPEAGTNPSFTLQPGIQYYPALTYFQNNSIPNTGAYTILNEVENPYSELWPLYQTWTA